MRILIVEDEPTLGQQLKSTLEQAGYAIDLSTDGEDGHFLGSTEEYDAVILDLGLPEIDGLTVLGMWRREGRKFPVLVLTARDSWSDKVAGLEVNGLYPGHGLPALEHGQRHIKAAQALMRSGYV